MFHYNYLILFKYSNQMDIFINALAISLILFQFSFFFNKNQNNKKFFKFF